MKAGSFHMSLAILLVLACVLKVLAAASVAPRMSCLMRVRISGLPSAASNLRVTFRLGEFECAAEGQDPRALAMWAANLKREVFDV